MQTFRGKCMVRTQWKVVRISLILVSLSFGVISFLLPIYSKALGLSAMEIGGMFSIFSLMLLIIKPLMGQGWYMV